MKSTLRCRFVSSLVAISVAVPSAAAFLPSSTLAASPNSLNPSEIKQVQRYKEAAITMFQSLTPAEKDRLRQVRDQVTAKPLDWWRDQILQNPEVIEKLKAKDVTVEEASAMLRDMVALLYTPGDTIESLLTFKKEHYHTWTKVFGTEFKQEDLLKFAKMMQKQVAADIIMDHMLNINRPLDDIINNAIARMMKHGEFKKFGQKLAEIGITPEDVIAIRKRLVREFDPNNEVRDILIRAFARNYVDIIVHPGKLTPGKEKQVTLKVDFPGYWTIRSGIEWESSNPEVATIDAKGKLHAHKSGTTTVSVKIKGVVIAQTDVTIEPENRHKPDKDKEKDDKDKGKGKEKDKDKGKDKGNEKQNDRGKEKDEE